jgi:AraC-like DNA-binding protein
MQISDSFLKWKDFFYEFYAMTTESKKFIADSFWSRVNPSVVRDLIDQVPGIAFFAKDTDLRIVAANRQFFERLGVQSEEEILGLEDHAIFPKRLAHHFREDDMEVLQTGQPKLNIVELFFSRQGIPDWFLTHKYPVFDREGRVMGIMGITQTYQGNRQAFQPFMAIEKAVRIIREQYRTKMSVTDLAEQVKLSPRQLQRRFHDTFGCSPQAFILKVRLQAACEMLQTEDKALGEIANETGFSDQSAFAQHFKRSLGVTPRQYQARFRIKRGPTRLMNLP